MHASRSYQIRCLKAAAEQLEGADDSAQTLTVVEIGMTGDTAASEPIRLVVVDEYPAIRDMLVLYFTEEGFHVSAFATADEAIRAAPFGRPEVIVLGIKQDDFSSLDRLRRVPVFRDTPIVTLSSSGGPHHRSEAAVRGADAALSKPALPDEIVQVVRDLVERRRAGAPGGHRW